MRIRRSTRSTTLSNYKNPYLQPFDTVWAGLSPSCRVEKSCNTQRIACIFSPCRAANSLAHPVSSEFMNTGSKNSGWYKRSQPTPARFYATRRAAFRAQPPQAALSVRCGGSLLLGSAALTGFCTPLRQFFGLLPKAFSVLKAPMDCAEAVRIKKGCQTSKS